MLLTSVRENDKIRKVFETYRPQIVFHAAAHKHVPLMETSPNEAVKNNKCCAIMIEMVQGEGGVNALDKEFVAEIDRLKDELK